MRWLQELPKPRLLLPRVSITTSATLAALLVLPWLWGLGLCLPQPPQPHNHAWPSPFSAPSLSMSTPEKIISSGSAVGAEATAAEGGQDMAAGALGLPHRPHPSEGSRGDPVPPFSHGFGGKGCSWKTLAACLCSHCSWPGGAGGFRVLNVLALKEG